jgi:hypothetical protein
MRQFELTMVPGEQRGHEHDQQRVLDERPAVVHRRRGERHSDIDPVGRMSNPSIRFGRSGMKISQAVKGQG